MLMIDGGFTLLSLLSTIPDIVAAELEQAGVDAEVRFPRQAWNTAELEIRGSAVLRVFGVPSRVSPARVDVPASWLVEATSWILTDAVAGAPVMCMVQGMTYLSSVDDVEVMLGEWERGRPGHAAIAIGDMTGSLRVASFGLPPEGNVVMALSAGGTATGDDQLLTVKAELEKVAWRLAPSSSYSFIDFDRTLTVEPAPDPDWRKTMDGVHSGMARELCDEIVFDAYPFQVLGPGHVGRLGGVPAGARPLAAGAFELRLGDAPNWLVRRDVDDAMVHFADRRDPTVQQRARKALEPCLLSVEEASAVLADRFSGSSDRKDPHDA